MSWIPGRQQPERSYLSLQGHHLVPPPALVHRGNLDPGVQMGAKHPDISAVDVTSYGERSSCLPLALLLTPSVPKEPKHP